MVPYTQRKGALPGRAHAPDSTGRDDTVPVPCLLAALLAVAQRRPHGRRPLASHFVPAFSSSRLPACGRERGAHGRGARGVVRAAALELARRGGVRCGIGRQTELEHLVVVREPLHRMTRDRARA